VGGGKRCQGQFQRGNHRHHSSLAAVLLPAVRIPAQVKYERMNTLLKAAVWLLWISMASVAHASDGPVPAAPLNVSVCSLLRDPSAYNHKLVKVSGVVSRGFEDFTLSDGACSGTAGQLWLELGGRVGSGVMYCCGVTNQTRRADPLVVEGVVTSMLEDAALERFKRLTRSSARRHGHAHATLVGVYFAGEKQVLPGGTFWGGYGHLGMFSLLVIEQVVAAEQKASSDRQ
jgi:hypothetical protein